jgi:hypothetical protein
MDITSWLLQSKGSARASSQEANDKGFQSEHDAYPEEGEEQQVRLSSALQTTWLSKKTTPKLTSLGLLVSTVVRYLFVKRLFAGADPLLVWSLKARSEKRCGYVLSRQKIRVG